MNTFKYLQRQLGRLKIDMLMQGTFLAGDVPSIDNDKLLKTASTNYEEVEIIFFKVLPLTNSNTIVDVGCGKGRVFNYLLYKGLKNKMIGYEINTLVADKTKKRLSKYKNVEILSDDIFNDFPKEGDIFYLYNPFKEEMMREFMSEILKIKDRNPIIIYNTPILINLFYNDENFTCEKFDLPVDKYGYTFTFAVIRVKG